MKKNLLFIVCFTSSVILSGQTHSSADKLFQGGEYGISFALIALMIAIGIGIPARKAMKIDPAEALHNE